MLLRSVTIGLVAFLAVWALRMVGGLDAATLWIYDAYVAHAVVDTDRSPRITVVTVSEADIQEIGAWPMSDARLADLVELLAAQEPRVIGLDIYRDIEEPPGSERLARVLAEHENVIGIFKFPLGEGPWPASHPVLTERRQTGFSDVIIDDDGIVRRWILFMGAPGTRPETAFPVQVARRFLAADGIGFEPDPRNGDWLRIADTTLPKLGRDEGPYREADVGGYQILLDYRRPVTQLDFVALGDVLDGVIAPELVRDRVVLVGSTAASVPDRFYTPVVPEGGDLDATAGVVLHAQVVDQLLRAASGEARILASVGARWLPLWVAFWCVVGAACCVGEATLWRPIATAFALVGSTVLATFTLFVNGLWLPPAEAALGAVLAVMLATVHSARREAADRETLMALFGSTISPEVANRIWEQRKLLLEGGRPRPVALEATVLFSDVQGFTGIAERMSPAELLEWLNEYLDDMASVVMRRGGMVVQFVGDAVMAAYGAPIPREREEDIRADACQAVATALEMDGLVAALNARLEARGLPLIGVRIGINSGRAISGLIGSRVHREYNVQGDAVNTAARLESLDRDAYRPDHLDHPCRILLGARTHELVRHRFECERLGELELRGKEQAEVVYRVLGERVEEEASTQRLCQIA